MQDLQHLGREVVQVVIGHWEVFRGYPGSDVLDWHKADGK